MEIKIIHTTISQSYHEFLFLICGHLMVPLITVLGENVELETVMKQQQQLQTVVYYFFSICTSWYSLSPDIA